MRSWHFAGEYFARVEQVAPHAGASGHGYVPTIIYEPCGCVVRAATRPEAERIFHEVYRSLSPDVKPWRNVRLAGEAATTTT